MTEVRKDHVIFYRDNAGEWRWERVSGWNGKTVSGATEGYARHIDAVTEAKREFGDDVLYVEQPGADE